jgi:hypothetical protein
MDSLLTNKRFHVNGQRRFKCRDISSGGYCVYQRRP